MSRSTTHRRLGLAAALTLLLIAPFMLSPYRVFQLNQAVIYAICIAGLVVLLGSTGQISVAHSAFFAVGAYTAGALMVHASWPFAAALMVAALFSGILGAVTGIPALRVSGLYLVLVTLALAVATPLVVTRLGFVTGGGSGLQTPRAEAPGWSGLADDQWRYLISLVIAMGMFLVAWNIRRGRIGRAMLGVRDRHLAATSLGINVGVVKIQAFTVSGVYAGVAGALYVYTLGFIAPGSVSVLFAILLLTGAVIGGVRSLIGAALGGAFIQYLPVITADMSDGLGNVFYGMLLVIVMLTVPGGLVELMSKLTGRFRRGDRSGGRGQSNREDFDPNARYTKAEATT